MGSQLPPTLCVVRTQFLTSLLDGIHEDLNQADLTAVEELPSSDEEEEGTGQQPEDHASSPSTPTVASPMLSALPDVQRLRIAEHQGRTSPGDTSSTSSRASIDHVPTLPGGDDSHAAHADDAGTPAGDGAGSGDSGGVHRSSGTPGDPQRDGGGGGVGDGGAGASAGDGVKPAASPTDGTIHLNPVASPNAQMDESATGTPVEPAGDVAATSGVGIAVGAASTPPTSTNPATTSINPATPRRRTTSDPFGSGHVPSPHRAIATPNSTPKHLQRPPHNHKGHHQRAESRVGRSMSGRNLDLYRRNSVTGRAVARQARKAPRAWKRHAQRNCSIVVDLFHVRKHARRRCSMHLLDGGCGGCGGVSLCAEESLVWRCLDVQGMMRSTIVCPKCKHESVAFDPHMCLSLPVPVPVRRVVPVPAAVVC